MQAKVLAFAISYFSESGLFNGLRPIQVKKFLLPSSASCDISQAPLRLLFPCRRLVAQMTGLHPPTEKMR
jgi:hypothetical protein